ncbi:MAG TPA: pentapeptide repeat-containing protein, partial [Pseudomonas sp.]|nr:pentapeptide repeat-containing protein [Pseudomonas sp.]
MNYLPLLLLLCLPVAHAEDGDDAPLIINGCTIAAHSQCPGANLKGANLRNQDLSKMNLAGADLR